MREYVNYNAWIHQHQTRRDFVDKRTGRIPPDSIYCHFDFIHNIDVSVHWGDSEKVAYMVSYDRFRDETECIEEESNHYFCDDKKHDWGAALTYIRKHLTFRKQQFEHDYSRQLKQAICYSDNGEFRCSGFFCKLGEMAEKLNTSIVWNFTAAGHSKGKHDGEGHVIKAEYRSAMISDTIKFDKRKEPYSTSIAKHMTSHFNNDNKQYAFDRTFDSISVHDIKHYKSKEVCKRIGGISNYHSFLITRPNIAIIDYYLVIVTIV